MGKEAAAAGVCLLHGLVALLPGLHATLPGALRSILESSEADDELRGWCLVCRSMLGLEVAERDKVL